MSELRLTFLHTVCSVGIHREPQVAHGTCLESGFCTGLCCVHTPEVDMLAPAPMPVAWFCLPDEFALVTEEKCDIRENSLT